MTDPGPGPSKRLRMYTREELQSRLESGVWSDDDMLELISEKSSVEEEDHEELNLPEEEVGREEFKCKIESDTSHDFPTPSPVDQQREPTKLQGRRLAEASGWSAEQPETRPQLPFTAKPGIRVPPQEMNPVGFFELFFTLEFLEMLVQETNTYAEEVFMRSLEFEAARIFLWHDTTVEEMRVFLGIIFYMGVIKVNRVNDYWITHHLFGLPVSTYMGRDRFLLLLRCLHFHRNQLDDSPLKKIEPIINFFNGTMKNIYYPGKNLCLDGSMVAWRGRLRFRQYLKGKKHKYGMKLFVLAETNGMVQSIHIYGGADDEDVGGRDHPAKVVKKLIADKTGVGHSLYMNNYFMSVPLVREMLQMGCYCTGTLRVNRRDNPKEVVDAKLQRGQVISRFDENVICVCKWKDKRDVLAISSEFGGELVDVVTRRGPTVRKPRMVAEYNKYMKGVDSQDHMIAYYPFTHKTTKWYKKLGIHVFQMMIVNSHFLYSKVANLPKKDLHDFTLDIVSYLLPKKESLPRPSFQIHLPAMFPRTAAGNRHIRKRCKVCLEVTGTRNDTIYTCAECPDSPGLCLEPCFRQYHDYD